MDTKTGYDNVNIGFNCRGTEYGCRARKYNYVSNGKLYIKIQVFLIAG